MSLGRLLSSGKTLIGAQGESHRFRVNQRVLLPKFNLTKNPFASGAQQERAEARPTAAVPTEAKVRATNAPAPPVALRKLNPTRALKWVGGLGAILDPRMWFPRQQSATSNAARVPTPVQRELSLESVQVLRNDLSDADGEACAWMKPAPRHSGVQAMTAKAEAAMDRLSSKLFGQLDG
jgi:hypothetical protein